MSKRTTSDSRWEFLENSDKELTVHGSATLAQPLEQPKTDSRRPALAGCGGSMVTKVDRVTVGPANDSRVRKGTVEPEASSLRPCATSLFLLQQSQQLLRRVDNLLLVRVGARPASPGHGGCCAALSTPASFARSRHMPANSFRPTRHSERPSVCRIMENHHSQTPNQNAGTAEAAREQREIRCFGGKIHARQNKYLIEL